MRPHGNKLIVMKAELLPTLNPLSNIILGLPHKQSNPSTQSSLTKLPPGAKTIGNYLLGKNIGEGTFGKVHLALHLPTSQKVAVKIIDKSKMRPRDVQRVVREIEVLKKVRHRHVVTLYEIIETEKSLLLVTEFLPNGELFRHIIKQKRLHEDEACALFQQIIEAVDYLHRNKVAHRDLKPENILIDHDKQLKVIDFGLSALYEGRKQLQTFCGSPCYAAPQMVEARQSYSPLQADLWSCGIILFAMLSGHLPFCDADTHTLFKKILACSYKVPSHISPEGQELIQKLLVLAPEKRISIQQIRQHNWFQRVPAAPTYGIDFGQQLQPDEGILERLKAMGIAQAKIREELLNNQKNKDTATYLIMMKKLIKSGELVPSYIGDDNFNPKLIIPEDKMPDQQDTQSYNQLQNGQVEVKAPDAPEMPTNEEHVGPLAGSMEWYSEELKEIDEGQLMLLAGSILDLFLPKEHHPKPSLTQIHELFPSSICSPIKKIALEKRESQFYAHNRNNARKIFTMGDVSHQGNKKLVEPSTIIATRGQMKSSARERLHTVLQSSISKRELTVPARPKRLSEKQRRQSSIWKLPASLKQGEYEMSKAQSKCDIILPNLSQRPQTLKASSKGSFLSRRYKMFRMYLQ